jgi:hypothetical protein
VSKQCKLWKSWHQNTGWEARALAAMTDETRPPSCHWPWETAWIGPTISLLVGRADVAWGAIITTHSTPSVNLLRHLANLKHCVFFNYRPLYTFHILRYKKYHTFHEIIDVWILSCKALKMDGTYKQGLSRGRGGGTIWPGPQGQRMSKFQKILAIISSCSTAHILCNFRFSRRRVWSLWSYGM